MEKILEKSGKSQGILSVWKSGNPVEGDTHVETSAAYGLNVLIVDKDLVISSGLFLCGSLLDTQSDLSQPFVCGRVVFSYWMR